MNYWMLIPLLLCIVGILPAPAASAKTERITLTNAGKPAATIITAQKPTPAARLAALELQYHIKVISGAVLPIRTDADSVTGTRLLVGESDATRQLGLKGTDFASQEFLIRFLPKTIVIMGRDWQDTRQNRQEVGIDTVVQTLQENRRNIDYGEAVGSHEHPATDEKIPVELPSYFDDQGTCYATYDFLERFCHVRWYGPTELNLSAPHHATLTLQGNEVRRSPAMKYRYGTFPGDWPILKEQWNNASVDAINLYLRRMRVGGEKWAGNHSFYESYYRRFGKQDPTVPTMFEGAHPEFFAQGYPLTQNTQLCYTNPGLIHQVAQDARDFFDGKGVKGNKPAMGDYFAVVPMDDARWCKCANCQALLNKDKENYRGEHFGSGTASHYLFNFVNEVAKEVRKTHPDKYIATLAYHVYSYPPDDLTLEPNVSVAPCLQFRNYWAPRIKKNDLDFYNKWVAKHDRPIFLWNYYCFPMEPAVINKWHCFPGFSAHLCAEMIKKYHHDGVRGVFLCGIGEQVDFYLTMKMYDNPNLNPDSILKEFFQNQFGAAADPMKRFYLLIEQIFSDSNNYPAEVRDKEAQFHQNEELAWKYLGTPERMEELGKLMAQAEQMAQTPEEKQRVALWKTGVWDYMVAGRQQYLKRIAKL